MRPRYPKRGRFWHGRTEISGFWSASTRRAAVRQKESAGRIGITVPAGAPKHHAGTDFRRLVPREGRFWDTHGAPALRQHLPIHEIHDDGQSRGPHQQARHVLPAAPGGPTPARHSKPHPQQPGNHQVQGLEPQQHVQSSMPSAICRAAKAAAPPATSVAVARLSTAGCTDDRVRRMRARSHDTAATTV